MWAAYIKEKNVYCPALYNDFVYLLEPQMHKNSKLGILTNVSKSRLAKVTFTNIHKMSDACANSFDRYIWLYNVWEMFLLFIKFEFLRKNGISEKIKAHFPHDPSALQ